MNTLCSLDFRLVLDYIKVFLSWPIVVGIAAIYATRTFKTEVAALVNRIASVEFPGGKLVTQQAKLERDVGDADTVAPAAADPTNDVLQDVQVAPAVRERLRAVFEGQRAAARMWEYRYLNYFFAPDTQGILDWLIQLGQDAAVEAYEAYWMTRITNPGERRAILTALSMHGCIILDGPAISVTDKGREYAAWSDRKILSVVERVPV
ncbi:hypothetical protein [Burkholderia glumae]|uniref:hypothetical protein n=1 Tax=Burkholderia glumae TaxID=337 RepID=UPI001294893D|nr:hypothetical protein [Burkholderia glumae]MCM2547644.1 hypothetical protein [Burkholderia glumae]QGA37970.1 hypothetical protein GAS19_10250 [Burkholderia glumae]